MNEFRDLLLAMQDQLIALREQKENAGQLAYTGTQLAEMFGVCSYTLRKWRQEGKIGYSQIGSVIIYPRDDVLKFLQDNHFGTAR